MKQLRSGSDITIGDCWGIGHLAPQFDDDKGISVALFNSENLTWLLPPEKCELKILDYNQVIQHNPSLLHTAPVHPKREIFFRNIDDFTLDYLRKFVQPSIRETTYNLTKEALLKTGILQTYRKIRYGI